jgi:hypothetical protein
VQSDLKEVMMEKAEPIKRIFKGIIDGDETYYDIYPPGFCPRDGFKLKKREDGLWCCPNCGLIPQTKKEIGGNHEI